jgi:glycosyltransferase involved in cell wall biosynthesis
VRIALVSTCAASTPPRALGSAERVVGDLAKGLVALGHEVTVFATADSEPAGALRYTLASPVWPSDDMVEARHAALALRDVRADRYDVLHVHHPAAVPPSVLRCMPTVATMHHVRRPELVSHYAAFPEIDLVAISRRQAALVPELHVGHVVHHGLDLSLYPAGDGRGGYCVFLGHLAPEKAPHVAIDAARGAGVALRIGGGVHPASRAYYEDQVAPRLADRPGSAELLGELAHPPKVDLLRRARCLLAPLDREEPFGLAMIEAMLVGTPVIALSRGSAPEVVDDGVTGLIVRSREEMTRAIATVQRLDRRGCRTRAQERWCSLRMTREYLEVYAGSVERHRARDRDGWEARERRADVAGEQLMVDAAE